ncbi:Uncharacterised protein [Vibrio cholerae]|nr:Uncharacterised protein [Vibrio cholerae]
MGWLWRVLVYVLQYVLVSVWACNTEHIGVYLANFIFTRAEAARHNHFAVLFQRFANGIQRLLHRTVDKTTGVNDHHIGVVVAVDDLIPLSA